MPYGTEHRPKTPVFERPIGLHRRILRRLKNKVAKPEDDVDVTVRHAHIVEGLFCPIIRYRPRSISRRECLPTIFFVPGTGFIGQETAYTNVICSLLVKLIGCQLIIIRHRLAPEYKAPIGVNDAYEVFRFLHTNSVQFQIDIDRTVLMGYSSGGNFAALMAIRACTNHLNIPKLVLVSPLVDLSRSLISFQEFEMQDQAISRPFLRWLLDLYIPDDMEPNSPLLSPFWARTDHLALPPTDIIFGDRERFRSDAEEYAQKLERSGTSINRFMFAGDHGIFWRKREVIETIARRLKFDLGLEPVPRGMPTIVKLEPGRITFIDYTDNPSSMLIPAMR